jgi:pimeloyl-ACP methyl ester carboxylesterase
MQAESSPVYCFSGLGADFRIFSQLEIQHAQLHAVNWEMPMAGEALPDFALRLAGQITHPNPVLLGVSFGGMLVTEIAKRLPHQKAIIISSCKARQELPWYFKAAGRLGLHKVVPYESVTKVSALSRFIFDSRSKAEELYLKQMMLRQTQVEFIRRSVNMILNWQNQVAPHDLIHIHGTKDRLLIPGPVKPTHWIDGGGHFMVWNMAEMVSTIINRVLSEK